MAEKDSGKNIEWWQNISILIIALIVAIFVYVLIAPDTPEILLSGLLVIGVISLIVALCLFAVIFKTIGLADKKNTLGLPEGSVRAVIALTLILLFMMSSVFLYWQVTTTERGREYRSINVTQEILDSYPGDEVVAVSLVGTFDNQTRYNVTRIVTAESEGSQNLAQQLVTILGTLVAAISAFYFGTKAAEAPKGDAKGSFEPAITKIEPNSLKIGEEETIKIHGKNLDKTTTVRLAREMNTVELREITSSSGLVTGKLKIAPENTMFAGKWSVIVTTSDGGEGKLEDAFEVKTQ
jgi:hypothetical protein